jgi:trehalose 6-phosphate synthase
VNWAFAQALADEGGDLPGARYLVQDYHLSLVPAMLRALRPRARIAHFSHIPFAGPGYLRVIPPEIREELLAGLLGSDVVGFQAPAWADAFLMCCRELSGARIDLRRQLVRWEGREIRVRVYPISIDQDALRDQAGSAAVAKARRALERLAGDTQLLVRVDRAELSKNILRGLLALEVLLENEPARRRAVTLVAHLTPSRERIPEYRAYRKDILEAAARINARFGKGMWTPARISVRDEYEHALAAYQRYDVLLVNPIFDGMNLVAKEGPTLNERNGVLILSETAGAFTELGRHALGINPFDVEGTARAMATALDMGVDERSRRARGLRAAVARNPIDRWVSAQLADLERMTRSASTDRRGA